MVTIEDIKELEEVKSLSDAVVVSYKEMMLKMSLYQEAVNDLFRRRKEYFYKALSILSEDHQLHFQFRGAIRAVNLTGISHKFVPFENRKTDVYVQVINHSTNKFYDVDVRKLLVWDGSKFIQAISIL